MCVIPAGLFTDLDEGMLFVGINVFLLTACVNMHAEKKNIFHITFF